MTTKELKNKIDKVLGNSIRCLIPSYWWKKLFNDVIDKIDNTLPIVDSQEKLNNLDMPNGGIASVCTESKGRSFNECYEVVDSDIELTEEELLNKLTKIYGIKVTPPSSPMLYQTIIIMLNLSNKGLCMIDCGKDEQFGDFAVISFDVAGSAEQFILMQNGIVNEKTVKKVNEILNTTPILYLGKNIYSDGLTDEQGNEFTSVFSGLDLGYSDVYVKNDSWKKLVKENMLETVTNAINQKQDILVSGSNIKTINGRSILGSGDITVRLTADSEMSNTSINPVQNKVIKKYIDDAIANVGGPSQSITITTWAELKTMRDSSVLIPGSFYRIVDYVTTTSQEDTNSAEHQFDVVLLAITSNSLLEEGWAAKHDGDVYFSENNSNLNSWKIGYCLDNDSEKFSWASENGTGIIYRMIDEFGNDCPYDFKNIQFKRKLVNGILDLENGLDSYVYTFNLYNVETNINEDYSLKEQCHDNIIKLNSLKPCFLSNNVFLNLSDYMNYCDCNSLAIYCLDNTFGDGCRYNKFNEGCSNNIFGPNCGYNIFDYSCYDNVFSECYSNIIQNNFATNKCGYHFFSNTVGAWCSNNWFGEYFNNNIIGNGCCNNIFGESIDSLSSEVCGYHITGNIHDKVLPLEGAREYDTKVSLNSNGEVKIYCEADLIS